ncbi:MAG: hypothetical protein ACKOJF_22735 [Planctomycetaceae bacterium]
MAQLTLSFMSSLVYAILSLVLLIAALRYRRLSAFCLVVALASFGSLLMEGYLAVLCLLWMNRASSSDPMTYDQSFMLTIIRMNHVMMNALLTASLIGLMGSLARRLKTSPKSPAPPKRTPPPDNTVELTLAD